MKGHDLMNTSPTFIRKRKAVKLITVLLLLSLLFSELPAGIMVTFAASNATCSQKYTVQSGDTLIKIAAQYKVNWLDIAEINNLKAPYTIYIGQYLCIPSNGATSGVKNTSSSATSTNKGKAPYFTASRIERNKLVIETNNFPKNSFYYVKVRSGSGPLSEQWTKVNMLRTRKESSATYMFNLPNQFREHSTLVICLKNVVTDAVFCKSARR
jgi:spore germination protein YaaH